MRDTAREYFDELGLSYSDINEGDILILSMLVNKELKSSKKDQSLAMRLSQKIKSKYKTNGKLVECYLFVNSHYFTRRECISFNNCGFIGFCGWASDSNAKPIVTAFKKWCDYLADCKKTDSKELGI